MRRLPLFIISMVHFSMPNSILISWLYNLICCIRLSNSFSFLTKSLMPLMYIKWLFIYCDLLALYPAVHFLKKWSSGIMVITDSNGDSASPWNMPLWNPTHQVYMVFSINFMSWLGILYIFDSVLSSFGGPYRKIFIVNPRHSFYFRLVLLSLRVCLSIYSSSSVPPGSLAASYLFVGKIPRLISE